MQRHETVFPHLAKLKEIYASDSNVKKKTVACDLFLQGIEALQQGKKKLLLIFLLKQ